MDSSVSHKIPVTGGVIGSVCLTSGYDTIPLIYVNGGPGGTYLDEHHGITALADERDVVLYDQLGSYHSSSPFDEALTPMPRFVEELKTVLDYYEFDKAIILGHSFGGAIAADFALANPKSVAGLILSSPLLSTERWLEDARILLRDMPDAERTIIEDQLSGCPVDDAAYDAAEKLFYKRHLCRLDPWPDRLLEGFPNRIRRYTARCGGVASLPVQAP